MKKENVIKNEERIVEELSKKYCKKKIVIRCMIEMLKQDDYELEEIKCIIDEFISTIVC